MKKEYIFLSSGLFLVALMVTILLVSKIQYTKITYQIVEEQAKIIEINREIDMVSEDLIQAKSVVEIRRIAEKLGMREATSSEELKKYQNLP